MPGIKGDITAYVPALQAGEQWGNTCSRGCTPGCHNAGFQPYAGSVPTHFSTRFYHIRKN